MTPGTHVRLALEHYTDALLEAPLAPADTPPESRLSRVRLASEKLSDLLVEEWPGELGNLSSSLRALGCLACLPSLTAQAAGQPHTQEVAKRVSDNFQGLSQDLLEEKSLSARYLRNSHEKKPAGRNKAA